MNRSVATNLSGEAQSFPGSSWAMLSAHMVDRTRVHAMPPALTGRGSRGKTSSQTVFQLSNIRIQNTYGSKNKSGPVLIGREEQSLLVTAIDCSLGILATK